MLLLYRLLLKVDVAEAALDGRNALRVVEQRMQRGGGWRVKQASEKRQDVQKCYCQLNFYVRFSGFGNREYLAANVARRH